MLIFNSLYNVWIYNTFFYRIQTKEALVGRSGFSRPVSININIKRFSLNWGILKDHILLFI